MTESKDFCPYVGLRPFTKKERRYFFGRDGEKRVIYSNLSVSPLTVLYGPSGTGKSSLLHAGLIPAVRLRSRRAGIVYFNRWSAPDFLEQLKQLCIEEARRVARNKKFAVDASLPLDDLIAVLQVHLSRPMLVVLDQFEEYLHYHPEVPGVHPFETQLASTIARADLRTGVLLALREDSLSQLDRFRTRIPDLLGNTLRIQALGDQGAEDAIRKPLEVYNNRCCLSGAGRMSIETELVSTVISQMHVVDAGQLGGAISVGRRNGSNDIEAAVLQLVMTRLWEEERKAGSRLLRLDTLMKKLGGVEEIVKTHFDRLMDRYTATERDLCASIFRLLVTPSGRKVAYPPDQLAIDAQCDRVNSDAVLAKLVGDGVLRRTDAPERYELLHDILGGALIGWRNRHVQKQQIDRLEDERKRDIKERDREFASRRRKLNMWLAVGAACVLFPTVVFTYFRWRASRHLLAHIVSAQFEVAAENRELGSERRLAFLLRARDVLRENKLPLEHVEERLTQEVNSWHVTGVQAFAFAGTQDDTNGILMAVTEENQRAWWNVGAAAQRPNDGSASYLGWGEVSAISRDGRRVAMENYTGTIVLGPEGKTPLASLGKRRVKVLALSDDQRLLVRQETGRLEVWDKPVGGSVKMLSEKISAAGLLFRPSTTQVIARAEDGLQVVDCAASGAGRQITIPNEKVTLFTLSRDGQMLVCAGSQGGIWLQKIDAPPNVTMVQEPQGRRWLALGLDRSSTKLAALRADMHVLVWDLPPKSNSPQDVATLGGGQFGTLPDKIQNPSLPDEEGRRNSFVFSHDLRWLASQAAWSNKVIVTSLVPVQEPVKLAASRVSSPLSLEETAWAYNALSNELNLGISIARTEGDAERAEMHFQEALRAFEPIDPGLRFDTRRVARAEAAEGQMLKAQNAADTGDYAAAEAACKRAEEYGFPGAASRLPELRERSVQVRLLAAGNAVRRGDFDSARQDLDFAQKIDRGAGGELEKMLKQAELEQIIREARLKLNAGDTQGAHVLFVKVQGLAPELKLDPQREINLHKAREAMRLAWEQLKTGGLSEAIFHYAEALMLGADERFPLKSSFLAAAFYDPVTQVLEIDFRSGARYRYAGVPPAVSEALAKDTTGGSSYFNLNIRGRYQDKRVDQSPASLSSAGEAATSHGFSAQLLVAADAAAKQVPPNYNLLLVRAVARALNKNFQGATDDLAVITATGSPAGEIVRQQSMAWTESLRRSENPFSPELLKKIFQK